VENGLEVIVAQSYSKNLGLYGERVGALNFVLADSEVG
jgi:aspartate/tyrosine/aromatic aminotransferase